MMSWGAEDAAAEAEANPPRPPFFKGGRVGELVQRGRGGSERESWFRKGSIASKRGYWSAFY
jgi:hypothetical protein